MRNKGLWFLGAVAVAGAGGFIGFWVFLNVAAHFLLTDQPLRVQLPPTMTVKATTTNQLDVHMEGFINAKVPLQQTLEFPISGDYNTEINLDHPVELTTVITYRGVIPIDTYADIVANVTLNYQNVKQYRNLQLKAKLPMKLRMPINLKVPVKQMVRVKYRGPMKARIDHLLKVPVDTTLNTKLKVNQDFMLPVTSSFPLSMVIPQTPLRATIHEADLYLPLHRLRAEQSQDEPQPESTP